MGIPEVIHRAAQLTATAPIAESRTSDLTSNKSPVQDTKVQDLKLTTKCLLHDVK